MLKLLITVEVLCAVALPAAQGPGGKPQARVPRIARIPALESYQNGQDHPYELRISDFRQRQPRDGQPASQSTTAYLSYDGNNLYAVFVCRDDPSQIRAHMNRRDSISEDDKVGISLDTFRDGQRAYMFFSNPLGVQLDGITTEGQPDDYKFDTVWHSEGRILTDGYVVRIAIPFRSLRFSRTNQAWGIALTRQIRRSNEYACWPYITDRIEAYVSQFAQVTGIQADRASRNVELTPYMAGGWQDDGSPSPRARSSEVRGGLDAKLVLRDSLTLDVTANPDFSQVESDEPQVTVNQRYELFFPEKRPFFLENAGFFETPETLFFSRRIGSPSFGARLSGKIGDWAIGALVADDRTPGLLSGSGERARIGVGRVERSFGSGSKIGAFFSDRDLGYTSNRVASLDARVKLNANWVATGQMAHASTRDKGEPSAGASAFGEIRFSGRHLQYATTYRDRSPGFRVDLGFIPRADIRQVSNSASYRWRPESGVVASFGPSIRSSATWNHAGMLQDWFVETPFRLELRRATTLIASRSESFEAYRSASLRTRGTTVYGSTDPVRWFGITTYLTRGCGANYYPVAGLRPWVAGSIDASVDFTLRPNGRLRFDETYYYNGLSSGAESVFRNHVLRSKVNYQFTRALSVRAILDYNNVAANRALSTIDPEQRVTTDLLVTYMVSPGTAVYAGYNSRRSLIAGVPFDERSAAQWDRGSRLIFVKLAYRLRL